MTKYAPIDQTLVRMAAAKGFRLHHCLPMTGATPECWMVQRGFSMRFFNSLDDLREALASMDEYVPVSAKGIAGEAALRQALAEGDAA